MLLSRLLQTTTFRITLIYLILFGGLFILGLMAFRFQTAALIADQTDQTIQAEVRGLAEANRTKGVSGLQEIIQVRSSAPDGSLYHLAQPDGTWLVGNLRVWPDEDMLEDNWLEFQYDAGQGAEPELHAARAIVFRLTSGHLLLVGRDIEARRSVERVMDEAMFWIIGVMVALGAISGVAFAGHINQRLDTINRTARDIVAGDLSRRVPVSSREDEIDQVAENLNNMLDQIQRLMSGMREVTDNVAHDLRSPLNRLRSRIEVTLMQPSSTKDDYRAALQSTIEDANHLLGTFNALLSIAQVEAGSSRDAMTRVDTTEVVRDIAELYEALAEAEDIGFECLVDEGEGIVWGNRELVSQALANLVDNAIKYTPAGGAVRLSLCLRRLGAPIAELSVSDTGPGIPAKDRARVLNRFVRLEASRSEPGSGLGLSLVSAVARMHEGRLELGDSDIPKEDGSRGLMITLSLPILSPGYASSRPPAKRPTASAAKKAEPSRQSASAPMAEAHG